jgi:beta-glucosidase
MDLYEDKTQTCGQARGRPLLSQMTLEEKAGIHVHQRFTRINDDGSLGRTNCRKGKVCLCCRRLTKLITEKKMNHFNVWVVPRTKAIGSHGITTFRNLPRQTRLGIPMSRWLPIRVMRSAIIFFPCRQMTFRSGLNNLGFAAIGDEKLMQQHADMATTGIPRSGDPPGFTPNGGSCYRTSLGTGQRNVW